MNMTKQPVWGNDKGEVIAYMDKIDFEEELGNAVRGNRLFPSDEDVRKQKPCVKQCGIVKVKVTLVEVGQNDYAQRVAAGRKFGFMHSVAFYMELGGAKTGSIVYPSNADCEKHEPYAKRYGIVPVEVELLEVVQETDFSKSIAKARKCKPKGDQPVTVNPNLLALEAVHRLADLIQEWLKEFGGQRLDVPEDAQPEHLLNMCQIIEKQALAVEDGLEFPPTKLHRWIGHIQGCLITTRVATVDQIKEIMRQAKLHFGERPDDDLMEHLDPESPFFLDIGGES